MDFVRFRIGWIAAASLLIFACAESEVHHTDDDPDDPELTVTETLELQAQVGEQVTEDLVLANDGEETLEVDVEPTDQPDWLDVEAASFDLDEDETADVPVTATCPETEDSEQYDAALRITSNDPNLAEATVNVELTCHGLDPADLTVNVEGLPDDVDADITVEGPYDFTAELTGSDTLDELVPGEYVVTADDVQHDITTYTPADASEGVVLEPGAEDTVTVRYDAVSGDLTVDVEGLPDDVDHDIEVVGDDDTVDLPQDGELSDLSPGSYTLVPDDVDDGAETYSASEVDVTVASGETENATVEYLLEYGSLQVDVAGLPNGVDHDIDLVDDDGDPTSVPQSGEMDAVEPGDYSLQVNDVTDGLATYTADESSLDIEVTIESEQQTSTHVGYELVDAEWEVAIDGLPSGVTGEVDIEGGDLDTTITDTTSWNDLTPDSYSVEPKEIVDGVTTYGADDESVDVESGSNDTTYVDYAPIPGTLNVDVSGVDAGDADIDIIDENNDVVDTIDGPQTLSGLTPGSYTIDPADVDDGDVIYSATTQTATVFSDDTTQVSVSYQEVEGQLELSADGLPDGEQLVATIEDDDDFSSTVTGEQTLDLAAGDYTVTFHDVDTDSWTTYEADPETVTLEVDSDDTATASTDYERVDGELQLTADGLPDGEQLEATVESPDGSTEDYTGDQTLEELTPGAYTVTFHDVDTDEYTTYEPDPEVVDIDVNSGEMPTASTDYERVDGGLSISATGLPGNLQLEVTVTGPDGYDEDFTGGQTIDGLTPGEYTVAYEDVDDGTTTWEPDPQTVDVDIESGEAASASAHYDSIDGTLDISADGVPSGEELEAVVDGPDSYSTIVTGDTTLDGLDTGEYTVDFQDIDDGPATYSPNPGEVVDDVESGETTYASTTYELVHGSLELTADGLDGNDLQATVDGPDDYSESFTGAQTIDDLVPGDYTVTFESVEDGGTTYTADPTQVDVEVESDETATASTDYELVEGGLEVSVDFPDTIQQFTLQVRDDNDDLVASDDVTDGDVVVFDDLETVEHTVTASGDIYDQWDNEYLHLDGFDEPHQVNSGEITEVSVSGTKPTLVQTEADDGDDSLREVVDRVNPESVVTFDDGVETITLDTQIEIQDSLLIAGEDRSPTIQSSGSDRLLYFHEDADDIVEPTLQSLTLADGHSDSNGGAIENSSALSLSDVKLENNHADSNGGAIYADGELTLTGVDFIDNFSDGLEGGALVVGEDLFAEDVQFIDNEASSWGGAVSLQFGADAEIYDAVFDGNSAGSFGGAFRSAPSAGDLHIERALFVDNYSGTTGGAIRAAGEDVTIINTTFYGNEADNEGGAMRVQYSDVDVELTHVTMVDNTADEGPAIHWDGGIDASVSIAGTLVADNGDDQSEFVVSQSDDEEQITSSWDNVVTSVDDDYFSSSTFDETGTVDDPIDAHINRFGHNAGRIKTVSVTDDSPAHELVLGDVCVDDDQRGYDRPDGNCTAGAWEMDPNLEDFDNLDLANQYTDGDFTGNDGIEWYYEDAKNASSSTGDNDIDGNGLILRGDDGLFGADDIPGGIDELQLQYRMAYSENPPRQFEVLINGDVVETSPEFGTSSEEEDIIYTMEIDNIDVDGDFDIEVRHLVSATNAQVTFDNIRWE